MVAIRLFAAILCAVLPALRETPAQQAPAAPERTYELRGRVLDASGRPLDLVEVALVRGSAIVHTVLSADDGWFSFGQVRAGPVTLRFRRLGYTPAAMELLVGPGGHPTISEIILIELPSQLADIQINTDSAESRYRGFYERRQQRASFARFLEHEDILRLGPPNPSDLFRSVPGITILAASPGNTIRIRGCQPMVWVDGQRVPGAELDEVIRPGEIGAIEFYPSFAGVPAQFMERGNRLCGLILVWTR